MSSHHQTSVFKTSCLKLPINPSNKLPIPAFEHSFQLPQSPLTIPVPKGKKLRNGRKSSVDNNFHIKLATGISSPALKNVRLDSAPFYKFSDFLGSIPDYSDVNNLPSKEFYEKINHLKMKQKKMYWDIEHGYDTEPNPADKKTDSECGFISNEPHEKEDRKKSPTKCVRIDNSSIRNTPESESSTIDTEDYYKKQQFRKIFKKRNSIGSPMIDLIEDDYRKFGSDSDDFQQTFSPAQRSKSAPNSPLKNKPESPRKGAVGTITIPKPFHMTVRDEEEQIVNELMTSLDQKEPINDDKSNMFRAHPVPIESRIPLFDQINEDRERRREIAKLNRKIILTSQLRPFSFTKREDEMREISKLLSKSSPQLDMPSCSKDHSTIRPKPFKAKPIPKNLFSNYFYQKMREDEYYRAMKRRIRSEEMLKASSFPPSMAARDGKDCDMDGTTPESRTQCRSPRKRSKSQKMICSRPHADSHLSMTPSTVDLHSSNVSNLAALLRMEATRKRFEMDMQQKLEDQRRKQETRWRAKLIHRRDAWKNLQYDHEEELAMRLQIRREEEQLREEQFRHQMELMLQRVEQMPYLFERS